jgi:hypothetical protein
METQGFTSATAVQVAMINHVQSGAVIVWLLLVVLVAYAKNGLVAGQVHLCVLSPLN